jgi:hypothetical protein
MQKLIIVMLSGALTHERLVNPIFSLRKSAGLIIHRCKSGGFPRINQAAPAERP